MGEQVCETDVEDRCRGMGVDRDGGCKQGTDMGRQEWGQVEEWTGRGDMCEDGEEWEENEDWRGGRRHRCGEGQDTGAGCRQPCPESASHRLAQELLLWPTDSCPVGVVSVFFFLPSQ